MRKISLLLPIAVVLFATAFAGEDERQIEIENVHYPIQHSESNWKNSTIAVNVEGGRAGAKYKLHNGRAKGSYRESGREFGGYDVTLDGEYHLDARHTLLLITEETAGGTSSGQGVVQVVVQDGVKTTITQEITYDSQSPHSGARYDPEKHLLTVRGRGTEEAHCCPTSEDEAIFKWNGWRFVLLKWRRIPLPPGSGY